MIYIYTDRYHDHDDSRTVSTMQDAPGQIVEFEQLGTPAFFLGGPGTTTTSRQSKSSSPDPPL